MGRRRQLLGRRREKKKRSPGQALAEQEQEAVVEQKEEIPTAPPKGKGKTAAWQRAMWLPESSVKGSFNVPVKQGPDYKKPKYKGPRYTHRPAGSGNCTRGSGRRGWEEGNNSHPPRAR